MRAMRSASQAVVALLLVLSADAAAQAYHPAMLERAEPAPALVLGHSLSALNASAYEVDMLDGFSKRRANGVVPLAQQERWTLYGRFGLVKFRNDFDPQGAGAQVTWRNTGPGLGGKRLFIGFQRRF